MRQTESVFRFGAQIIKAQQDHEGDWVFEGIASLPGKDLQGEEVLPEGLDIDYLLGKGLPPGAGGFVNYDHSPETIVGVPLDGKISHKGFWLKWKALKTPLMRKVVEQMRAMKEAGWPRRYGMSIEGVVKERDPADPTRIKRAFIRNVALTPTPVHPGTFVDFAKSLSAGAVVEFRPPISYGAPIAGWARTVRDIRKGLLAVGDHNPYFFSDGRFRQDGDVAYFADTHHLPQEQALWCARYALSRERWLHKALDDDDEPVHELKRARGHPWDLLREHLRDWKAKHPECPHIAEDGSIRGGAREAARHFYGCEKRRSPEISAILGMLQGSGLLKEAKG